MSLTELGIIVIGRNEGKRLEKALNSLPKDLDSLLYVDSGSEDGSPALAQSIGVSVHELSPDKPFSASRARKEGVEILLKKHPSLEYLQFLDGDCTLDFQWCHSAIEFLSTNLNYGICCGFLEEDSPEVSIFNKVNSIRWETEKQGEVNVCGGVFMVTVKAYKLTGGFNGDLLTCEEAEFCSRIKKFGYQIYRLNRIMAIHDSNLLYFKDWWNRAVWGGYGDAIQFDIIKQNITEKNQKKTSSNLFWALYVPALFLIGLLFSFISHIALVVPSIVISAYILLFIKVTLYQRKKGQSYKYSFLYSLLCIIEKMPYAIGFYRYKLSSKLFSNRPDPHSAV